MPDHPDHAGSSDFDDHDEAPHALAVEPLRARVEELERRNRALERAQEDAAAETARMRTALADTTGALRSITSSRAWKLVTLYRRSVKERLLPAGTGRRRAYDTLVGAGARHSSPPRPESTTGAGAAREDALLPPTSEGAARTRSAGVSVVIPTLNAGAEFQLVLERIRAQRDLPEVEIVAVDSGSSDGTLPLCERHGVKVVPFPGGPFNHGLARNVGAAAATGDFLVFMSQDALPAGTRALSGLVGALLGDPTIAAATARQIPRSDADLFTCWQHWGYRRKVLRYGADTVVGVAPGRLGTLSPAERHRAAQIDNVLACVRRSAFDRFRFRELPIAEDLDLGLRLLEGGHRIAFMSSVVAVHSHTRPAGYHLRRSFTEWRTVADLIGAESQAWARASCPSLHHAVRLAACLYGAVGKAIGAARQELTARPVEAVAVVRAELERPGYRGDPEREPSIDRTLRDVRECLGVGESAPDGNAAGPPLQVYLGLLASFAEYLAHLDALDGREQEVYQALFKLCAEAIGHSLADFGTWTERNRLQTTELAEVDRTLGHGV